MVKEKAKEMDTELFFVQVKDPSEVRKNILETLRDIVGMLKRFEAFRHLRNEKIEKINKLRNEIKSANKLIGLLKAKLPQTNLKVMVARDAPAKTPKPHHKKGKKAKAAEEKTEKIPKKELTETDKLESQLNAIEDKLKGLM